MPTLQRPRRGSQCWSRGSAAIAVTGLPTGNTDRARHWYERFTDDWKDADPDIPELIEARERLGELKEAEGAAG